MQITIDTSATLSDTDRAILALVAGTPSTTIVTEPARTPAKAPAKAPATKPAPVVEEPAEEEPEEDLIGGEPTVQDAVDRATVLVNAGEQAKVKAALKASGASRVSNISPDKVAAFIAALED